MQSDIVQRLLAWSPLVASGYQVPAASQTMDEAAAEIERLQTLVAAFNNGMPPITTKEAAAEITRLTEALRAAEEREKALREALGEMVYETTHLSPMKENGDHDCTIKANTLERARAALKEQPHADA